MKKIFLLGLLLFTTVSQSQILAERERSEIIDQILAERFNEVLPMLMDRTGIDMWILISREYNEDPVLRTMLPSTWLNARRRTVLVFNRKKYQDTIEKLAIARYNIGENIDSAWDKEKQPDQWKALIDIIKDRNPEKIGLNFSENFGIADGLVKTDFDEFKEALPEEYVKRIVSAEDLAVGWIETRTIREMIVYSSLVEITHDIIAEAFSSKLIEPGVTTTEDVVWWMRQKVTDMGMETWFHPTVDIQRNKEKLVDQVTAFSDKNGSSVILPGDLLHCDFGITYLRLNTDCQQMAYVLKDGETAAPDFLQQAFNKGNELQDILISNFETGLSGNEILRQSLEEAKERDLKASIYTHPLGLYGHSAGPTIGMWDQQGGVPGTGDYKLYENTVYAIELNTEVEVPEWNKSIRIMLEEAGFWGEDGFRYVNKRQRNLMLIPSEEAEN
ncbi:M24 family metallopeptidase [Christiangramia forsetii]|uniref:Secreted peptidase, family M24 n=2 Tax=Christiangramia forsetii TaxID=411153 RepID=A0M3S4_CHRFK|nr:M24 family metallopeptidase [Christiangramia forsetii]GGG25102.1 Xaa-Pro aminopeptidase [Christiangramia forsetii]CAL67269.1 secreted peptidase, family M24 [Christiangramia forsetii KT0803]